MTEEGTMKKVFTGGPGGKEQEGGQDEGGWIM